MGKQWANVENDRLIIISFFSNDKYRFERMDSA